MSNLKEFKELLDTREPAELGPGPRSGVRSQVNLNAGLQRGFGKVQLTPERQELIRALVLLWHDYLDEAHGIAQDIDNRDGAFVHAIMHRREPDYGNAAYWFRRAGNHEAFPEIAGRVSELVRSKGETRLERELVPNGEWRPFAFVNSCEQAVAGGDAVQLGILREVQRIEFEALLAWFCQ